MDRAAVLHSTIPANTKDLTVGYEDRSDRDPTFGKPKTRLLESDGEKCFIGHAANLPIECFIDVNHRMMSPSPMATRRRVDDGEAGAHG